MACLFSSISYLLYGTKSKSAQIRSQVVHHVSNNWQRFKCFTQQTPGKPYGTKRLYVDDMSKPSTQGSLCEVKAAAELFPYQFQIYQDGCLWLTFGEAVDGIKKLKFTDNYNNGQCDAVVASFEPINSDTTDPLNNVELETKDVKDLLPHSDAALSSRDETALATKKVIRSTKGKKRRKRFTNAIRAKQLREAAAKYAKKRREKREAVKNSNEK